MRNLGEQWIVKQDDGRNHLIEKVDAKEGHYKDLGPVNEDGCLESPIGKGFPTIRQNSDKTWVVFWTDSKHVRIFSVGATEQEAIDAWNWRT